MLALDYAPSSQFRLERAAEQGAAPRPPVSGGSQSAASVMPAVKAAAKQAQLNLLTLAAGDAGSPLHGAPAEELEFKNGKVIHKRKPDSGETFGA